jgi:hypothetical protein
MAKSAKNIRYLTMSKRQPELYKEKLLLALEKSLGIVTPACKEVGISRDRFYTYYNEDADFKKAVDDIQNVQGDFVENQLFKKIKEGSERSILFYMRYKGRKRGYSDELQINSNNISEISIKIIKDKDDLLNDEDYENDN